MKFIAKVFSQPGTEIEFSDESGTALFKGIVQQSNPDGAMIVQVAALNQVVLVWGPVPEAPQPEEKPITVTKEQMAAYQAELDRLEDLVDQRDKELVILNDIIAQANDKFVALTAQFEAAKAPKPEAAAAPAPADEAAAAPEKAPAKKK